ncbi:MAG: hypothetical protein HOU81_22515 [Hamadaea sp.]|uniref:hypothetical protein n=1 Tax=Hamadaea sp. TaxID=2024425 RepID=UPI0017D69832|nr:hypothetical protein [Hamadaea sp.]NUR73602.1 hypothetical protein [Hamadaea sp.]NUT22798.1 hypothetical protein [Hamadaea sp.]
MIEQVRRTPALPEAAASIALLGGFFLIGYAWSAPNRFVLWVVAGLFGLARLLLRRHRRAQQTESWLAYRDTSGGFGFEAHRLTSLRFWSWLAFVAFGSALAAYYGGIVKAGGPYAEPPPEMVFWPAVVGLGWYLRESVRPSRLLVTPSGVTVGRRLVPWPDLEAALLDGDNLVLELADGPGLRRAVQSRIRVDTTEYAVPAAELHWLIQHYLLFPADRSRMHSLPGRDFSLASV